MNRTDALRILKSGQPLTETERAEIIEAIEDETIIEDEENWDSSGCSDADWDSSSC